MKTRLLIIIGTVMIIAAIVGVGYSYQSYLFDHKEGIAIMMSKNL